MLGQLVSMLRRSTNKEAAVQQPGTAEWRLIVFRARCWNSDLLEGKSLRTQCTHSDQLPNWVGRCYLTSLLSWLCSACLIPVHSEGIGNITALDVLCSCPMLWLCLLFSVVFLCLYGKIGTSCISCLIWQRLLRDFKFCHFIFEGSFEIRRLILHQNMH